MPTLIKQAEVDYFSVGYGRLVLAIDGEEASHEIARLKTLSLNHTITCSATIVVIDKSSEGLTSVFEVNFVVNEAIEEK